MCGEVKCRGVGGSENRRGTGAKRTGGRRRGEVSAVNGRLGTDGNRSGENRIRICENRKRNPSTMLTHGGGIQNHKADVGSCKRRECGCTAGVSVAARGRRGAAGAVAQPRVGRSRQAWDGRQQKRRKQNKDKRKPKEESHKAVSETVGGGSGCGTAREQGARGGGANESGAKSAGLGRGAAEWRKQNRDMRKPKEESLHRASAVPLPLTRETLATKLVLIKILTI